MPVDDERILGPTRRYDDDEVEATLRPRRLAEYVGQAPSKRNRASLSKPPAREATPSIMCCSRASWPGKDDIGPHHRQRNGSGHSGDVGSRHRKTRGSRGDPHQSSAERRTLYR